MAAAQGLAKHTHKRKGTFDLQLLAWLMYWVLLMGRWFALVYAAVKGLRRRLLASATSAEWRL